MPTNRLTTLNFITGNAHKLSEVRAILGDVVDLQSKNVDAPEIQGTIEEIAKDKCLRAAEAVGGPVLTEDTALEFNALKGLPGPYMYAKVPYTHKLRQVLFCMLSFYSYLSLS